VVEYYYEIHWLVLILWIISVFPLLVGIVWVPIIVISSISGINFRIRSINKYAYDALIELNPVKVNQTSTYTQKVILNDGIQKTTNTPPPIRKNVTNTEYFIVINEEQKGPYDFEKIKLLINFNNINETTLIWKEGMEDWEEILNLNEFKQEFN
jgi:hypothetical protein